MATMTYDVFHQVEWGGLLALYFFVGGLSAGSFITSAVAALLKKEKYRPLIKIGGILALVFIALTPVLLIVELEQPTRFWHLFVPTYIHLTSFVGWGTIFLSLFGLVCLLYYLAIRREDEKNIRLLGGIGIPLAMFVATYTGYVLASVQGRALWNSAILPVLFMVSAVISGLAIVLASAIILNKTKETVSGDVLVKMATIMGLFLILDLLLFAADGYVAYTSGVEEHEAAMILLSGPLSFLFIGVQLVIGALIPILLLLSPGLKGSSTGQLVASIFVLAGALTMRYLVLAAGQAVPLS